MPDLIIGTIKTAIVTGFTIAAALIWKDVILEVIEVFVPTNEKILYKLLAAFFLHY